MNLFFGKLVLSATLSIATFGASSSSANQDIFVCHDEEKVCLEYNYGKWDKGGSN